MSPSVQLGVSRKRLIVREIQVRIFVPGKNKFLKLFATQFSPVVNVFKLFLRKSDV